jgi:acetate kinase
MLILTVNAGSSSLKFALFDCASSEAPHRLERGHIERIGLPDGPAADQAVEQLLQWIGARAAQPLAAVAHRIVHGGAAHSAPARLTAALIGELRALSPYDPEHMPQELRLAEALQRRFPDLPQVACFDTAFHHAMPRVAQLLPLPRRLQSRGLRRYGFHGISYAYLMHALERTAGAEAACGRIVLAHLGNGASLAAVR